MTKLLLAWIAVGALVIVVTPAVAQDAYKVPGRAPLIVDEGTGKNPGSRASACERERREREKRRAQGLPVKPLDPNGPCRTQDNAGSTEPPLEKADDRPIVLEYKDPAEERRRRRIQQNQGNQTQPPLR